MDKTWYQLKHSQTGYVLAKFPDAMLATDYRESLDDNDRHAYSVLPAPSPLPPPGHVLLPDGRVVKVSQALAIALKGRANDEAAAAQAASKEKS